jgi:predicted esterase
LSGPEQIVDLLSEDARARGALLLAPEASLGFGSAFHWSFKQDAHDISVLVRDLQEAFDVPSERMSLVGYASGCTTGLCIMAENPGLFGTFVALAMGSAFEPFDDEESQFPEQLLKKSAGRTRVLFVCDPNEPISTAPQYDQIVSQLRRAGLVVDVIRPSSRNRNAAEEMKSHALEFMLW